MAMSIAAGVCPAENVAGGAASYRIKLDRFVTAPNRGAGLLVRARLNGGPILRLLLDSGSEDIVVDRATALRSHCNGGMDLDLVGAGAGAVMRARHLTAKTLELGDLTLRDIAVIVQDRVLADGVQGVLPLSVFSDFVIRLDFRGKELDLFPYGPAESGIRGAVPILPGSHQLFVKGTANGQREGYFLVDTGAALTAISYGLARQLRIPEILADRMPLWGGVADIDAPLWSGSIRLSVASRQMVAGPVAVVDLSTASRYHGFEISGLIGYSTLYDSVLTASYRDRTIRIEPK